MSANISHDSDLSYEQELVKRILGLGYAIREQESNTDLFLVEEDRTATLQQDDGNGGTIQIEAPTIYFTIGLRFDPQLLNAAYAKGTHLWAAVRDFDGITIRS